MTRDNEKLSAPKKKKKIIIKESTYVYAVKNTLEKSTQTNEQKIGLINYDLHVCHVSSRSLSTKRDRKKNIFLILTPCFYYDLNCGRKVEKPITRSKSCPRAMEFVISYIRIIFLAFIACPLSSTDFFRDLKINVEVENFIDKNHIYMERERKLFSLLLLCADRRTFSLKFIKFGVEEKSIFGYYR